MVSYWWIGNGCWRRNLLITTIRCCFGHFGHQHPLSFYISFGHQHSKDVTKIHKSSPTISRQHHCSRLDANDHFAQTSSTSCLRGIKPLYDMNLMPMVNNKLKKSWKWGLKHVAAVILRKEFLKSSSGMTSTDFEGFQSGKQVQILLCRVKFHDSNPSQVVWIEL